MFRHVRDSSGCYRENRLLGGKSGNEKVGGYCESAGEWLGLIWWQWSEVMTSGKIMLLKVELKGFISGV